METGTKASFKIVAATLSWLLPIVGIGIKIFFFPQSQANESDQGFTYILLVFICISFVLGVIGVSGAKEHGLRKALVPGLIGVLINGFFISLFFVGVLQGYEKRVIESEVVTINTATLDYGSIKDGTYSNDYFGLTITVPQGWIYDSSQTNFEGEFEDKPALKREIEINKLATCDIFKFYKYDVNREDLTCNSYFTFTIEKLGPTGKNIHGGIMLQQMKKMYEQHFQEMITTTDDPQLLPNRKDSLYVMPVQMHYANGSEGYSVHYAVVKKGYALYFTEGHINEADTLLEELIATLSFEY